jgi:hypothetical protein
VDESPLQGIIRIFWLIDEHRALGEFPSEELSDEAMTSSSRVLRQPGQLE